MPLMRSSSLGSSDLNDDTDSQISNESSPDEFSGDETESESRGRDQSCQAPHMLQPLKIQKVGVKVRPTEFLKEPTSQKLVVWKRLCLREEESPQQACQFYESLTSLDKGIPAVCRVRTQMLDLAFRHIDDYHVRTYSDEVFALTVQLFDTTLASPRFRGASAELAKRDQRHLTGVPIGKRGLVALTWGCVTLAAKSIHVKHFNPYRLGDCVKTSVAAVKTAELAVFASVDCRIKPRTSVGFLQALTGFTDDPLKCSRSRRQMYYLALFLLFCGLMQPHYLRFTSKTLALAATYLALRPFELSGLRGDRPTFASLLEEVNESINADELYRACRVLLKAATEESDQHCTQNSSVGAAFSAGCRLNAPSLFHTIYRTKPLRRATRSLNGNDKLQGVGEEVLSSLKL